MGEAKGNGDTVSTGGTAAGEWNPPLTQGTPDMTSIKTLLASLLLSLLLAGAALAGERININTADVDTIDRVLVNIGPAKAQAIVDYRKAHGAFKSVEQLALVKGIGLTTVEKNRDRISFGSDARNQPKALSATPRTPVGVRTANR